MDNKSLSHTKWKCQYHIVFIPKYRKKILYGRVRNDVREIISTLCKYKDVDIIAGVVSMVGLSTLFQTNFFRLFSRYCTGV
jgi:putative transposase